MDLFYQDYAPRDKFFDVDDFRFHAATYYSSTLNNLYQVIRRENKAETGFSNVELPSQWLIVEDLDLQIDEELGRAYFIPTYGVFAFDYDAYANGINGVTPISKECAGQKYEMIKIPNNQIWELQYMPQTNKVFYYLSPDNRVYCTKNVKKVKVWYIPTVVGNDDNCVLSDNIAADVIKNVLIIMVGARDGTIIQQSDDGNKNLDKATQVNPQLPKNLA